MHTLTLVGYKAFAELRSEAHRTYAGILWWVFEPILSLAVYYLVFSYFRGRQQDFALFLLVGIVIWRWTQNTVMRGSTSILRERSLMQQVRMPKVVFPATVVVADTLKFVVVFCLLIGVLLMCGFRPGPSWTTLPVLLVAQGLLIVGITFLTAAVIPFFPDFSPLLGHGLHLAFFLSGVIFPLRDLPEHVRGYIRLNPMAGLIENYRGVLMENTWPEWHYIAGTVIISICLTATGWSLIQRWNLLYPKIG